MKTSWTKLVAFDEAGSSYMNRMEETRARPTKFSYAVQRVLNQLKTVSRKFNKDRRSAMEDISREHCLTDPPNDKKNGKILRDPQGQYMYTKELLAKVQKEQREKSDAMEEAAEQELREHLVADADVPKDLTEADLEAFAGIVIPAETVARIIAEREAALDAQPPAHEPEVVLSHLFEVLAGDTAPDRLAELREVYIRASAPAS